MVKNPEARIGSFGLKLRPSGREISSVSTQPIIELKNGESAGISSMGLCGFEPELKRAEYLVKSPRSALASA